jgi:hypothetical protein
MWNIYLTITHNLLVRITMDELMLHYTLVNEEEIDVLDDEGDARAVAAPLVAGVEQAP